VPYTTPALSRAIRRAEHGSAGRHALRRASAAALQR
jgi:hypothetical protein